MPDTKKKLLIFVPQFPVLTETFIQREIVLLNRIAKDYTVEIFALHKGSGEINTELKNKVVYQRVTPLDIIVGFLTCSKKTLLRLLLISLKNKNRTSFSSLYLLIKSVGYSRILKRRNLSHIHSHFLSESSSLMLFVSEFLDLPFSISAHARDVFATSTDVTKNPELVVEKAKKASFIAVCNIKAWKKCKELAGDKYADKVLLHYHGLDPSSLPVRPSVVTDDVFKVVSIGRLIEKKGFDFLIDSAVELKKLGYKFSIDIIGPGSNYDKIMRNIEEKAVGDCVRVLGEGQGMPNSETLTNLANADCFVLPSIETGEGDAEGVPNTLVEAAFMSLPIITTPTGSITDFIEDGINGILVAPSNSEAIAKALQRLIGAPDICVNLGKNALSSAEKMFNINTNIHELDVLFSRNLASK